MSPAQDRGSYEQGQPLPAEQQAVIGEHGPEMVIFRPQRDSVRTRVRAWWHRLIGRPSNRR